MRRSASTRNNSLALVLTQKDGLVFGSVITKTIFDDAHTTTSATINGVTVTIEEGKLAPAFSLNDAKGNKVALKDFRGKNVIVYFYPRDNTSGCTKEAEGFRDLWKDFKKSDTVIVGISPDSEASHEKFAAKYELPFVLLSDPDKKVMTKYGAFGEKMMYGKKVQGVIRSTVWVDPKGKVKKHWRKVPKAADHPAKVLEQLNA